MTEQINHQWDLRVRIAWIILVGLSILTALNSLVLMFFESEPIFVAGWVAASLFFAIVLLIPFRKGERWAWFSAWIFAALLASVIIFNFQVGVYYLVVTAIVALCLLLTRSAFW